MNLLKPERNGMTDMWELVDGDIVYTNNAGVETLVAAGEDGYFFLEIGVSGEQLRAMVDALFPAPKPTRGRPRKDVAE